MYSQFIILELNQYYAKRDYFLFKNLNLDVDPSKKDPKLGPIMDIDNVNNSRIFLFHIFKLLSTINQYCVYIMCETVIVDLMKTAQIIYFNLV